MAEVGVLNGIRPAKHPARCRDCQPPAPVLQRKLDGYGVALLGEFPPEPRQVEEGVISLPVVTPDRAVGFPVSPMNISSLA